MRSYLTSLYIDLDNRLADMIFQLEHLSMNHPSPSLFKQTTLIHLYNLKKKVETIFNDRILENDFFLPNALIAYNYFNNEFLELELFRYLPIRRYDSVEDGYFQTVIAAVYSEIGALQAAPFVSCISNSDSYYWAYSKYGMIAVPQGEDKHLLQLSDLYHEIAHHIYIQHDRIMVEAHAELVNEVFDKQIGPTNKSVGERKRILKQAKQTWINSWAEELACDMIATFLVGPAYAWTNMKTSTVSSGINAIYSHDKIIRDHPSDEVRMRAILHMLQLEGFTGEAEMISKEWNQFLSVAENDKPKFYDLIFPDEAVQALGSQVQLACKDFALRSYQQQLKDHTRPISLIINEAWNKIRTSPSDFVSWQKAQIAGIRSLGY